ncbi:hypothetical protein [Paracoccus sp. (in: a-proteobacteria)]|uniref:hypothetical protein n=1 Tax=Paracoccus sp. TaxID=267 RepID=UPI00396C7B11
MSLVARISSLTRRDRITTVGFALTAGWLFLVALFWLLTPGSNDGTGGVTHLVNIVGVVMPVALVWVGVSLARQLTLLRAEADDLRQRLALLRPGAQPDDEADDILPERDAPAKVAPPARQTPPAPPPARSRPRPQQPEPPVAEAFSESVDAATLIQALNFPDGPDDHAAIEALRQSLKDPVNSRVLRASQDVVTLMAGHDVYMDDLPPDPARPEVWRRFAQGDRGSAVAALGSIHHPEALEVVATMLREDEIFRDTVHHFLRHFDGLIGRVVPELDDLQIAVLADTRSARAFMLLGRVSGVFG